MHTLTFLWRKKYAPEVWEYCFEPEENVGYTPGQYAHFYFRNDPLLGVRTFSLISHPSEKTIRLITRITIPCSHYKSRLQSLTKQDSILMHEPMGDVVLPRQIDRPLLFVAQGIALASYISMLLERERSELSRPITLLWARRSEDDGLEKLIPGEIQGLERVDIHYPAKLTAGEIQAKITPQSLTYLSGSQSFVESIGAELEAAGTPRERLIYDYYEGYDNL